ncbi:chorismate mutase [candidate division GN15 bacterium]|nr:chorismate mutase [candidate division GN15 bacterium]
MIRGIRGAVCASQNTKEAIYEATSRLLKAVMERNSLAQEDIISILLTATPDLNADFPAYAIRGNGFKYVPVLCAAEIAVPGAMSSVIRMLVHARTDRAQSEVRHVYLDATATLRPDLGEESGEA